MNLSKEIFTADDNATVLAVFEIDPQGFDLGDLEKLDEAFWTILPWEYRLLLPICLDAIEKFGEKAIECNAMLPALHVPFNQLRKEKFGSDKFLATIKAENAYFKGWVAPALSDMTRRELELVSERLSELLEICNDPAHEYTFYGSIEDDLRQIFRIVAMALGKDRPDQRSFVLDDT